MGHFVPPGYCPFCIDLHLLTFLGKKQHVSLLGVTASRNGWEANGFPIGDALARCRAHRNPPPSKTGCRWLFFLPIESYGLGIGEELSPLLHPSLSVHPVTALGMEKRVWLCRSVPVTQTGPILVLPSEGRVNPSAEKCLGSHG